MRSFSSQALSVLPLIALVEDDRRRLAVDRLSSAGGFIGNMSERAVEMLTEEIEYLGAVKVSAVEDQQQKIVDVVRGMEDAGEIELNQSGEEEELVQ